MPPLCAGWAIAALLITFVAGACSEADDAAAIRVDEDGFPIDWPITIPPGTLQDCDNGEIVQDDSLFSVLLCLPPQPDPFTEAQNYLDQLEREGFVEREPGQFITELQTFLDGNGIEVFYQLVLTNDGAEGTTVLVKPA